MNGTCGTDLDRSIAHRAIKAFPTGDGAPVGTMVPYSGGDLKPGFILCEGQSLAKRRYPHLWEVLGPVTVYGSTRDSFALPDTRGRKVSAGWQMAC